MGKQRPDGLYVAGGPLMGANRKRIADFALKSRLPSMYGNRVSDFTLGTHPISTKGTTQVSGAKRRSDFELFTLSLPLFSTLFFSL